MNGELNYLKEWSRDKWNVVDLLAYILFIGAYVARVFINEQHFEVVLGLFSISFLMNIMRFYQLFYISEKLGPKITMILGMVSANSPNIKVIDPITYFSVQIMTLDHSSSTADICITIEIILSKLDLTWIYVHVYV